MKRPDWMEAWAQSPQGKAAQARFMDALAKLNERARCPKCPGGTMSMFQPVCMKCGYRRQDEPAPLGIPDEKETS